MPLDLPKLGVDFEAWGHWWLPDKESDVVPGRLSSSGGNLELRLLGQFDGINVNRSPLAVPVIHGVAEAKVFTLWDAIQGQLSFQMPGTVEQRFEHMRVLVGRHVGEPATVRFASLRLAAANLGPWSSLPPIEFTWGAEDVEGAAFRVRANRSREIALPDHGLDITIDTSISTKNEEFCAYGFEVTPSIHVEVHSSRQLDEFMRLAESLRRVFTLLIGVEFVAERVSVDVKGAAKTERSLDIVVEHAPPEEVKPLHVSEVLAPFPILQEKAQQIFSRWFAEEPRIKDPVDLFMATVRHESLRTHVELTTLAQALETFDRNVNGSVLMTKGEFDPIKKALIDAIPKDAPDTIRGSIHDRLSHAYEFTFSQRIGRLLALFDETLLDLLGIDPSTFPAAVSKARNAFTHWSQDSAKPMLSGADLSNLTSKLKAFTRLVLLSHLGVPPGAIVERMIQNRYLYLPEWHKVQH